MEEKIHQCNGNSSCCKSTPNPSVVETLDEMEWQRGIWQASIDNDTDRISELILRRDIPVDLTDSFGYTGLHYAARNGKLAAVKCLLEHGANINAKTKNNGATPLHRAVTANKPEVVTFLMKMGADMNAKDNDGLSAEDRALKEGNTSMLQILINSSNKGN